MSNSVLAATRRKVGFMSGKVLTEVTGSALAIVAVTTLSAQWKSSVPVESVRAPVYRPTLDPATGKIVDRLSPETAVGRVAVATFVAAPDFVAMASITPWTASAQHGEMTSTVRSRAISVPTSAESQPTTLAGLVPLPPERPAAIKVAATPAVVPSKLTDELPPSRLERVAGWFSPSRAVAGGAQVLSSGRDAIYSAVSYGGSALSRIYR